jgi:hypothetical protein
MAPPLSFCGLTDRGSESKLPCKRYRAGLLLRTQRIPPAPETPHSRAHPSENRRRLRSPALARGLLKDGEMGLPGAGRPAPTFTALPYG